MVEIGDVASSPGQPRRITPTDVSQFIRLEQCQRYLRLRLWERQKGQQFLHDYGVAPQSIPPLLTLSGAVFEEKVEQAVAQRYWKINFVADMAHSGQRVDDNARVMQLARELAAGEIVVLFQPRLSANLGDWQVRGDVDILRLERREDGGLRILITDMKSSTTAKVEHRLQVAFYVEMLSALLAEHGIPWSDMAMGVLYRGPADEDIGLSPQAIAEHEEQRDAAEAIFGTREGLLEVVSDVESYRGAVRDLVTGSASTAERVAQAPFAEIPYHLAYKCDGCLYNEFCMKWSAEHDDLSLLPYLATEEKNALLHAGIATIGELATLKEFAPKDDTAREDTLIPTPGKEPLIQRLAATWPVGPRLDELIYRARSYRRWKKEPIEARSYLPHTGYGSLPYSDAQHNPNLVRVYIDAQHDYLNDRIYMLGALVAGSERGEETPERRRSLVEILDAPPDTAEQERALLVSFTSQLLHAIAEVAAPNNEGLEQAPIHLIFFNHFEQRLFLDALARHFTGILAATPLYDFITQQPAFDSPIATFLDQEIRDLKNYPMLCQSLQAVAAFLGFNWNEGTAYRDIFRTRMFDFWGKFDEPREKNPWYFNRSRFNSQIPLEYAYAAWNQLPEPPLAKQDAFASYRGATLPLLRGFHARRLEAMERITQEFPGNRFTEKGSFDLSQLDRFERKAETLAQALDEFVILERHVELAAWKSHRLMAPERRVLAGETFIVRYLESDQDPTTAQRNRENQARKPLRDRYRTEYHAEHPEGQIRLSKEQRAECNWSQEGMIFRLRIECAGIDCDLDEMLQLSSLRPDNVLLLFERWTEDSRLPPAERVRFQPTPRQMLYGMRVELQQIIVERGADGRAQRAFADVRMRGPGGGGKNRGFTFHSADERPLIDDQLYTLDPDPTDWYGSFCAAITEDLAALEADAPGGNDTLYDRLVAPETVVSTWPVEAGAAQARFLAGLDALHHAGALHPFDDRQRAYIGEHGTSPTLLVQGPPGTGKSYSTAFALFARLQGALAADQSFRVVVSAKTHAATDVLLKNIVHVQNLLRGFQTEHPEIFTRYFDERLLCVPLFRATGKTEPPEGVHVLRSKNDRLPGEPLALDALTKQHHCIVATTPGGVYRMVKDKGAGLFGRDLCDCLVLDEASQMNLPEAVMAALLLKNQGQLIVVGDHRQMPPIVKHNWAKEPRRTFQEFRSYESLFLALLPLNPPMIQLAESFRLHADMAAFLRREIYEQDGIPYFSRKHDKLMPASHEDPFVAGVLAPDHTIVVIVHDEEGSMLRNEFEQRLITPILEALTEQPYHLEPRHGLGVVVPHRAQRAALQEALPFLNIIDPHTGAVILSAVDTVERFQGDERDAIMVSATESDRDYLLLSSQFLLDPRRLTVALSRAKHKLILVASRSIFTLFSADEETFANSQLWKNLLRRTCTEMLWEGERAGKHVEVWGRKETELSVSAT